MLTKRNIFLVIIIILISSVSAYATDFTGKLTYSGQYNLSTQSLNNTLDLNLNFAHNFTDDIFAEGNFIIKYNDKSVNPLMVIPEELYIGAYELIPNSDLKAGKLIISWGSADMLSPLDNFNPLPPGMSFTGISQKMGVWAADLTYYFDDINAK